MYKSKRISLRPFTESDAEYLSEMKMDFTGIKAYGGRPFPSNTQSEKEWISKMYPAGLLSSIFVVVEENDSKQFIGYCVASNIDYINSNAHVGIIFHKSGRGKGYFKEASILFYAYLFNEIHLHKVYSGVAEYNEIALENDKKIGFIIEGRRKEQRFQSGRYQDEFVVGLLAEDFFKLHKLEEYLI